MFALLGSSKAKILFGKHVKENGKKNCLLQNVLRNFKTNVAGKGFDLDVATENTYLFPTEIYVDSEDQTKDLSSDTKTY